MLQELSYLPNTILHKCITTYRPTELPQSWGVQHPDPKFWGVYKTSRKRFLKCLDSKLTTKSSTSGPEAVVCDSISLNYKSHAIHTTAAVSVNYCLIN